MSLTFSAEHGVSKANDDDDIHTNHNLKMTMMTKMITTPKMTTMMKTTMITTPMMEPMMGPIMGPMMGPTTPIESRYQLTMEGGEF